MPRVYVSRPLFPEVEARLRQVAELDVQQSATPPARGELERGLMQADAAIVFLTDPIDRPLLASARARLIAQVAVGVDNIDLAAAAEFGIAVTNTPGVLVEATADLAFGLILATARRLPEAERTLRQGQWGPWALDFMLGHQVYGKTLGILGLGAIGQAVARRASGFGMRVLGWSRSPHPEAASVEQLSSPQDVVRESDIVSVHLALSPDTRQFVDASLIAAMKRGAILINCARGEILDESALIAALTSGHLGGAGLDVFSREPLPPSHPLTALTNVVLLPHIGSATVEARRAMAELACDNVIRFLSGEPLRTPVRLPGRS